MTFFNIPFSLLGDWYVPFLRIYVKDDFSAPLNHYIFSAVWSLSDTVSSNLPRIIIAILSEFTYNANSFVSSLQSSLYLPSLTTAMARELL